MARLEDILPEIRKGRKVRCLSRTNHIIMLKGKQLTYGPFDGYGSGSGDGYGSGSGDGYGDGNGNGDGNGDG